MVKPAIVILFPLALALLLAAAYGVVSSQTGHVAYDTDGDGLIEIAYLEQLDAIRYDLDGDGIADSDSSIEAYKAAFPTADTESVCGGCSGYELARALDFYDPGSYRSGAVNTGWTEDTGWLPIGFGDGDTRFSATFDGNEYTIANLYSRADATLDNPGAVGLFGVTDNSSVIRDLGLLNVTVDGVQISGGLVGLNFGLVENAYSFGEVFGVGDLDGGGDGGVGGLIGLNHGTVSRSHSDVWVLGWSGIGCLVGGNYATVVDSYSDCNGSGRGPVLGGLVGDNFGIILRSYAVGNVRSDNDMVGGLVGWNLGDIQRSYAIASVWGRNEIGGLTGRNEQLVENSFASGEVWGYDHAGGLVGGNSGTVNSSYATGAIHGHSAVGGLVGWNRAVINSSYAANNGADHDLISTAVGLVGSNASANQASFDMARYATGNVQGEAEVGGLAGRNSDAGRIIASYAASETFGSDFVGGLIGRNQGAVSAAYAIGDVNGGDNAGGLIGSNSGVVAASYWNVQTSYQTIGVGVGNLDGISGKTTAELQAPTGYTGIYRAWGTDLDNADGDFNPATGPDDFWDFGASSQYPVLKADFDGDGETDWRDFGAQIGRPAPTPMPLPTPTPTPKPTASLAPRPAPTSTPTTAVAEGVSAAQPLPTATPEIRVVTATPTPTPLPEVAPTPTPTPTAEAGGGCGAAAGPVPVGAAAANLLLLLAPLGMIGGLKWSRRRKSD